MKSFAGEWGMGSQVTVREFMRSLVTMYTSEGVSFLPKISDKGLTPKILKAHRLSKTIKTQNMELPSPYVAPGLIGGKDQLIRINMDQVVNLVCEKMQISRAVMTSNTRQREILVPRQVAMAFTKEFVPNLKLWYIAKHLGGKNHATVNHAIKVVNETWMFDKKYGYGQVITEIHDLLIQMRKYSKR
jgi:hypothetical protein